MGLGETTGLWVQRTHVWMVSAFETLNNGFISLDLNFWPVNGVSKIAGRSHK